MSADRKFPDVLYAKIEEDGDSSYFCADADMNNLANVGETVRVGTYKLVGLIDVDLVMEQRPVKGR